MKSPAGRWNALPVIWNAHFSCESEEKGVTNCRVKCLSPPFSSRGEVGTEAGQCVLAGYKLISLCVEKP